MSKCHSCGATILWKTTKKGGKIPIDWQETPDLSSNENEVFDPKRMVSHFATCPNASQHRKGDKSNANSQ